MPEPLPTGLTDTQMRRASALRFVKGTWVTASQEDAVRMAQWILSGKWDEES